MPVHVLDKYRLRKDHQRQGFIYSMQECLTYLAEQARIEKFYLLEHMLNVALYSMDHPQGNEDEFRDKEPVAIKSKRKPAK
ncbi:MAG: hypothetical protein EYC62_05240 [Alphaproteobacteria bacterium]|nr:MAG: hypothetical protein EYC62_05240 [Alphaproteobacteria bacterium]